jgi:hypothetical protein
MFCFENSNETEEMSGLFDENIEFEMRVSAWDKSDKPVGLPPFIYLLFEAQAGLPPVITKVSILHLILS